MQKNLVPLNLIASSSVISVPSPIGSNHILDIFVSSIALVTWICVTPLTLHSFSFPKAGNFFQINSKAKNKIFPSRAGFCLQHSLAAVELSMTLAFALAGVWRLPSMTPDSAVSALDGLARLDLAANFCQLQSSDACCCSSVTQPMHLTQNRFEPSVWWSNNLAHPHTLSLPFLAKQFLVS